MSRVHAIAPLLVVGLGLTSCRSDEARIPLDAELRGAAFVDSAGVRIFDGRRAPVIAVKSGAETRPTVRLGGADIAGDISHRGPLALLNLPAPEPGGPTDLCVATEAARRCWRVRFEAAPGATPRIAALDALDLPALGPAVAGLAGSDRIWGHQSRARRLARAGRTADAVNAWREAAKAASDEGRRTEAGRSLRAASFMAIRAGRYAEAEDLLDEANERLGDAATRGDRLLDQYYRALVDYALSRYRTATLRLGRTAEEAWSTGHDTTFGFARDLLGVVLVDQGRISEAQALVDDPRLAEHAAGRSPNEKAIYLSNRAWIRLMTIASGLEPPHAAERVASDLTAALALAQRTRERHMISINLAWARLLQGRTAQAHALIEQIPIDADDPDAELMRGEIALRQKRLDAAAAAFDRAGKTLARTAAGLPVDNTWRAAYGLGRIAAARGERAAALAHFREALAALDAVGARAGVWHARARFYADRRPLVDDTLRLLLAAGDTAGAFAVVDGGNARALRALEARLRLDRLPAAVRAEWEQHRARFAAARQAWDAARDEGELLGPQQTAAWQRAQATRQQEMVAAFEAAEALLTREAPARVATTDAAAVAAALPTGSALLALTRLGDEVHGFWLAAGRPIDHRIMPSDATPARLVEAFADALPGVTHLYTVSGDVPAARELATAAHLGAPLGTQISLSDLAYAGLVLRPRGSASRPTLVVADPTIDLPRAHDEGRAVASRLPDARLLARGAATPTAVREAMAGARAMHYAGHGVARAESPWQAHLALAGETTLTVADILTADVPAGTVVLSGCRTGVRSALSTREALGLADAFVAAGSRAVLATRRNIPDDAAARFIARFHAEGGLEHPGAALMAATAAFHRDGDPIWSAFRLTGHP